MDYTASQKSFLRWMSETAADEETRRDLLKIAMSSERAKDALLDALISVPGMTDTLSQIALDEPETEKRFRCNLSFGTAGLRGPMKAGTNAMNVYTVAQATQGMATLIVREGEDAMRRGVVIAHDSRNNSRKFAECAAEVLSANGIHVYLFDALRPTPLLSFAIGHLHCIAGINITASHNPKEDNGYKAYWEDGAQISPEQAEVVSAAIAETDIFSGVRRMPLSDAIAEGKAELIGSAVDEAYLAQVEKQLVDPEIVRRTAGELNIVYTPLHGTGYRLVPEILSRIGVTNLYPVPEQMIIDGNFPTVKRPNPQYPEVFKLGIGVARAHNADLIIATDPDADRVGVMAKGSDGEFHCLTGNQMGVLLIDYIIGSLRRQNRLPAQPYAVKSIVSTNMAEAVCKKNGVAMFNTYTGFKFIGACILAQQAKGNADGYLLGFEESYGYLRGDYAKDKDAVVTTMLITEMAAYYRTRSMTLIDAMEEMYRTYGVFLDQTDDIAVSDEPKKQALMSSMRKSTPASVAGHKIVRVTDYLAGTVLDTESGKTVPTGMDSSDVLSFSTEEGDTIVVRPSGTEPKVKLYFLLSDKTQASAEAKLKAYRSASAEWF